MRLRRRRTVEDIAKRLAAVRDDLEALQGDARGLADDVGNVATNNFRDAVRTAEDLIDQIPDPFNGNLNGSLEPVRGQVREQPLAAIALSIGAGVLVGALLSRLDL